MTDEAMPDRSAPRRWTAAAVVTFVVAVALVVVMRATGRVWWCACESWNPVGYPVKSQHNSQHLFDAYSTSHILHGVIFFFALAWLAPRLALAWRAAVAAVVEVGWEILENSPIVLDRYRAGTAALGYEGDSVTNGLGDLISALVGFAVARRIGWRWSIGLFVAIELAMLWAIRDNLTLNVLMLLRPIKAIKDWQMA